MYISLNRLLPFLMLITIIIAPSTLFSQNSEEAHTPDTSLMRFLPSELAGLERRSIQASTDNRYQGIYTGQTDPFKGIRLFLLANPALISEIRADLESDTLSGTVKKLEISELPVIYMRPEESSMTLMVFGDDFIMTIGGEYSKPTETDQKKAQLKLISIYKSLPPVK